MKMVIKGAQAPKNDKKPKNPTSSSTIGTMVGQKAIQASSQNDAKINSLTTKAAGNAYKRLPAVVHNTQYAGLLQAPKHFNAGLSGMSGRMPAVSSTSDDNNLLSAGRSKELALLPLSMDSPDQTVAGKGISQIAFKPGQQAKIGTDEDGKRVVSKMKSNEPSRPTLKEQREKALLRFYQTLTNQPNMTKKESQNLSGMLLPKNPYAAKATARTGSTSNAYLQGGANMRRGRLAGTTYQSQVGLSDENEMLGFPSATAQGFRDNAPLQNFSSLGLRARGFAEGAGDHLYAASSLLQGFKPDQNTARGIKSSTGARPQKLIDLASLNMTQQKVTAFGAPHHESDCEDATAALKSAVDERTQDGKERQERLQAEQDGATPLVGHEESLNPFDHHSRLQRDTQASQMAAIQQNGPSDSMQINDSKSGALPDPKRTSQLVSPGAVTDDVSQLELERIRQSQQQAFDNDVSTVKYETKIYEPNSTSRKLDSKQYEQATTSPHQIELDSAMDSNIPMENPIRSTGGEGEKPRGLSVPGYTVAKITPSAHITDIVSNNPQNDGSILMEGASTSGHARQVGNSGEHQLETLPAKPQSAHSNQPYKISSAEKVVNQQVNSSQEMVGLQGDSAAYHGSNTTIKRFDSIRQSAHDMGQHAFKGSGSVVEPQRTSETVPLNRAGERFLQQQAGVDDLNEKQMQELLGSIQLMNSLQNQVNNATPMVTGPLAPSRSSMHTLSMNVRQDPIHISKIMKKQDGQLQLLSELSEMLPKDPKLPRNMQAHGYMTNSSGLPLLTNEGDPQMQGQSSQQAGHERFSTQGQEELVQQYQLPTVYSGDGRLMHAKLGMQKRTSTSYTGARSTKFSREAADSQNQTGGQGGAHRYWQSGQNFVAIPTQQKSAANFRTSGLARRLPPPGARKASQVTHGPAFGSSQYAAQSKSVNGGNTRLLPSQSFHRTSGASMLLAAGGPGVVAVHPCKNERREELQLKREVISTAYTITRAKLGIGVLPRIGTVDRDVSPRTPNESRQQTEMGGESRTPVGNNPAILNNKVMSHPAINAEQSQYQMESKNLDDFQPINSRLAPARSTVELTKASMEPPVTAENNHNLVDVKQPSVEKPHTQGMVSRMTADHACPRFMRGANMPMRNVISSQGKGSIRYNEEETQLVRFAHGASGTNENQRREKNNAKSEAMTSGLADRKVLDRNASDVNISGVNMLKLFSNSHVHEMQPSKGATATSNSRTKVVELAPNKAIIGESVPALNQAGWHEPSTLKKQPVALRSQVGDPAEPDTVGGGQEEVDDKIPNISRDLLRRLNIEDLADDLDSSSEDESCDSADDYDDHEPLIIQLMESMFTRKKTVQESEQMINNINVQQIKEEIRAMRLKERVQVSDLERQKQFEDRMEGCERLNRLIELQEPNQDYDAKERAMLKKNPFFLALKAQQIERNRFKRILQLAIAASAASDEEDTHGFEDFVVGNDNGKILSLEAPMPAPEEQQNDANDIFKHTFVNVEPGRAQPEQHYKVQHNVQQDITVGVADVNRAPGTVEPTTERQEYEDASTSSKEYNQLMLPQMAGPTSALAVADPYFFDHFSFDLPPEYYSSQLGDFKAVTRAQQKKLRDFLFAKFPSLNGRKLSFKVAYDSKNDQYNVLLLGKDCPLSRCCKMTVCFQFSRDIGGKVICLESLCAYNPLQHFFIDMDLMQSLFGEQVRFTQQSLDDSVQLTQTMPANLDTQQSQESAPVISKNKFKQLKPIFKRLISREISKMISKGRHGTASIRKVIETQANLEDHAFDLVEQKEVFERGMREMQGKLKLMRKALREPVVKPRGRLTQEDIYSLLYEDSNATDEVAMATVDRRNTEVGQTTEQRTQMRTRNSNYDLIDQQVYDRQDSIPGIFSEAINYQSQGSTAD